MRAHCSDAMISEQWEAPVHTADGHETGPFLHSGTPLLASPWNFNLTLWAVVTEAEMYDYMDSTYIVVVFCIALVSWGKKSDLKVGITLNTYNANFKFVRKM